MTHLHILGIGGTAMAGLAILAQESGWRVTGSDHAVYPPMRDVLREHGIPVLEGYCPGNLCPEPDRILVGNALSRGNPELEAILERGLSFQSGAEWFHRHVLAGRHPVVVTGTHGKTTTSSMVAWLWHNAGLEPGFLIGGIPGNFGVGARFPKSSWVIVEGDEYDTAFFDKRPKFHHYWPRTLILHNLEFDHADIYPDLESIRQQFRLLLRLVPRTGVMLVNHDDLEMRALVERHHALYGSSVCSPVVWYGLDHGDGAGGGVRGRKLDAGGSHWQLLRDGDPLCEIHWGLLGEHNIINGVAAAAAALHHGIPVDRIRHGLESFTGVARRLQRRFLLRGVQVYDDFAHHPTAIATTLAGLRAAVGAARIWVVLEPRSNTMRLRIHQDRLPAAFMAADRVLLARPAARGLTADQLLDVDAVVATLNDARPQGAAVIADAADAVSRIAQEAGEGDHVVIMSNGGFDGIHERLRQALAG